MLLRMIVSKKLMIVTETPTSTVHLNTFRVLLVNYIYFEHTNFFLSLNCVKNVLLCHNVNLKLMFIHSKCLFFFFFNGTGPFMSECSILFLHFALNG